MAREDERTFATIQAAVAGIVVALLAALATVLTQTCKLNHQAKNCTEAPVLFLASAPAIPFAALALLQLLGLVATLRSYYLRAVEAELRRVAAVPLGELAGTGLSSPSYAALTAEASTMRRSRSRYRILSVLILLITLSVFSGLTAFVAVSLGGRTGLIMAIGYGWAFLLLVADVVSATVGGRSTFLRLAGQLAARQNTGLLGGSPPRGPRRRGLLSYLLLPRPEDWVKWLLVPLAFTVVVLARDLTPQWGRLLLTMLLVEYLVYAARYQVNDIRGYAEDAFHPEAAARMRLPHPADAAARRLVVVSSALVAALRLVTALGIAVATGLTRGFAGATAVIAVAGVLYEYLRTTEARPGSARRAAAVGLWLLVGTGYALRYAVGAHAAGLPVGDPLVWTGALYAYGLGMMFVLLTWVLEASAYCLAPRPRRWYASPALRAKPHLLLLLRHVLGVTLMPGPPPSGPPARPGCGEIPVLRGRCAPAAPWNLAYWATVAAGAPLALRLAGLAPDDAAGVWILAVSAPAAALLPLAGGPAVRTLLLAAGTVLPAVGVALLAGPGAALFTALPFTVCGCLYTSFRQQSYRDLKHFLPDLTAAARQSAARVLRALIGRATWDDLTR
ncbi:hypothetical protein [Streptomyces seoulensis]|uniref:hypothetical protein n=1 Tax=Streptomyces seoulensis TaxID=73044 RepID=UPI001FCAF851|nr:hypothetical protein [Streptomyces seoulensis]BDH05825.1 hypothetical protein HEK131_30520 [Streptomyces seoulensis]